MSIQSVSHKKSISNLIMFINFVLKWHMIKYSKNDFVDKH